MKLRLERSQLFALVLGLAGLALASAATAGPKVCEERCRPLLGGGEVCEMVCVDPLPSPGNAAVLASPVHGRSPLAKPGTVLGTGRTPRMLEAAPPRSRLRR